MNGALVVDKPTGLTSHDVVAAARRALATRAVGHTGTLDPLATGVLPLVCGKATRLARFLSGSDKAYDVVARFGVTTDSYDITGRVVAESAARPSRDAVSDALGTFLGERLQRPPAFSAKKVAGERAYALARRDAPVEVPAVPVTLWSAEVVDWTGHEATLRLECSAGFYVRSLVHDVGALLGMGATVAALRRTRVGSFMLRDAVDLATLVEARQPGPAAEAVARAFVPMGRLLPEFPAVQVGLDVLPRVRHGQTLGAAQFVVCQPTSPRRSGLPGDAWTRVLGPDGDLVALAAGAPGTGPLHPSVVLI